MGWFFDDPKPDPKEQVTAWKKNIRHEAHAIDRQIRSIEREEEKIKRSCKQYAKEGRVEACRSLAKSLVQSRKAVNRLHSTKAQMNSVLQQMQHQLGMIRVAGAMQTSTEVMQSMSQLIRIPEISATMRAMSKEMEKAGLMEEMMDDTFEMMEDEDLEEEADSEVEKILFEITEGTLGVAPAVGDASLEVQEEAADTALEDDMEARLQALRG